MALEQLNRDGKYGLQNNSVSNGPAKTKKKLNGDVHSHSPRRADKNTYFEYTSPMRQTKTKFGTAHELTPNKFQLTTFSLLGNLNQQLTASASKRSPKEFRIQRSFRQKNSKAKNRPPLYSNNASYEPYGTFDQRSWKHVNQGENTKQLKAVQSK